MTYTIKLRRDTAADWVFTNPILSEGEPGYELDTNKLKFGDGVHTWTELPYFSPSVVGGGGSTQDAKHRGPWQAYPTEHIDFESGIIDPRLVPDLPGWTVVDSATLAAVSAYGKALDSRYPGAPGVSNIQMTVTTVSGFVDFFREIWSDDFDHMKFYVDGTLVYNEGGTSIVGPARPWTRKSFPVTAGTHTFKWEQTFDSTGFNGYNGWRMTDINWPSAPGENGYLVGDVVTYGGFEWRCNVLNTGETPSDAGFDWTKVSSLSSAPDLSAYAPLASPIFTGNPTAPTPTAGDNDTSVATTAFVQAAVSAGSAEPGSLVLRPLWTPGAGGDMGDVVDYLGQLYVCLSDTTEDPRTLTTVTEVVASMTKGGSAANDGTTPAYVNLIPAVNSATGSVVDGAHPFTDLDGVVLKARTNCAAGGAEGFFLGFQDQATAQNAQGINAGGMGTSQLPCIGVSLSTYSGTQSRIAAHENNSNWTLYGPNGGNALAAGGTFDWEIAFTKEAAANTYSVTVKKDAVQVMTATGVLGPPGPYLPRASAGSGGLNAVHQLRSMSIDDVAVSTHWRAI